MADAADDSVKKTGADEQDLTAFVQNLLGQMVRMQTRFQNMSDQIVSRMDEMGTRIDELEKSIGELMTQAGVDDANLSSSQDKPGSQ